MGTTPKGEKKMTDKAILDRAQTAFIRARIQLLATRPFWAHLALKLKLQWDESEPGLLSATDGVSMLVHPSNFLKLTKDEQVTVLCHEAWHCASGCFQRVGGRDARKWNLAQDIMIANAMAHEGFTLLAIQEQFFQKCGIDREQFNGMTSEAIYAALPDQQQGQGGGNGKGNKGSAKAGFGDGKSHDHWNGEGCVKPAPGQSPQELEAKWRSNVAEAAQVAKQAGVGAGAWEELVKAAMPKPPFTLKLSEYLNRGMGGDTSWDSFNRRFMWRGEYLPTDTRQVMGRVVWVADTSGSMGKAELEKAFGYARAFREQHPCRFDVICCDYGVASHDVYGEFDTLPETFKAAGRGGTSFDAPFALLREKKIDPAVVIYCTDGYGSVEAASKPGCPVLWVVVGGYTHFKPPFGEVCLAG